MSIKIVIVSGGFDPIHKGHIEYLMNAKKLGDLLFVILNRDEFLEEKKGYHFMDCEERRQILLALRCVDLVIVSIDNDQTVCETLRLIQENFGKDTELVFAKGGDRTIENIPEKEFCEKYNIKMVFGVGGSKVQSSTELVSRVMYDKVAGSH